MTDKEIVDRLAKREGADNRWVIKKHGLYYRPNAHGYTYNVSEAWIVSEEIAKKHEYPHDDPVTRHPAPIPPYLTSIDALRLVLATLTDDEWRRVYNIMGDLPYPATLHLWSAMQFYLTLDPAILARAVAEAIGGDK
jgi:hypothetical protein